MSASIYFKIIILPSLGQQAVFDCRMIPLPTLERVQAYLWRQEDAHRNSLNSHYYWLLRKQGKSVTEATDTLAGKSVAFKNELLFQNGINFDKLPSWQKRGIRVYWDTYEKQGFNPVTGKTETAERRELKVDYELPLRADYSAFIADFLNF